MKITAIRPYLKKLPLTKPYTIAYGTFSDVELVFLEIELANGIVGLGSASPSEEVVGETPKQTLLNLQSTYFQALIGRDVRHFRQIIFEVAQQYPQLPGTLAAVDIALHDAFGKLLGIPVVDFYGRKIQSLPTSVTIGIKGVQETLEEAKGYYDLGFKVIKVKTGLNLEEDIERILKLEEIYRQSMSIRVDANQGYTIDDLKTFIAKTQTTKLELIEQPLPVGQENELLELNPLTRSTLAADECLHDAKAALVLSSEPKPFGIFNIKMMKCGGLLGAFEIANIAQQADIKLFWGCNDESIVSITAALHAAFACPNTRYIDLDGSFDLAEDLVTGGFILENGEMRIGDGIGFGCAPLS
ncbi:MAG: dipeptide epimerase [Saprospiraceae bacterium]|nr:dipeptide epimerase [Saprospiraceae bacterium]